jgi:Domain of unknown function (DUF2382)
VPPGIATVRGWQGRTMVDAAGDQLGTIDAADLDDGTGQPEWATLTNGPFTATSGPETSEEEHEVTLHQETPVAERRVVARERVRLDTEAVSDQRQASEDARKEQLQVDDHDQPRRQDQR